MARILVVDDEEGIRRILAQVLEYEGHEVRTGGSGTEALRAALTQLLGLGLVRRDADHTPIRR